MIYFKVIVIYKRKCVFMKYLIIIVFLIFLFNYIAPIISLTSKRRQTLLLLEKYDKATDNYLSKHDIDFTMPFTREADDLADFLKNLVIPDIPLIEDLIPRVWDTISEIQYSDETIDSFKSIHSKLVTANYSYNHEVKKALRPTSALQNTFLFPSKLLGWFGFHFGMIFSRIWSIVVWIVTITLTTSIKEIVSTFLENIFNH